MPNCMEINPTFERKENELVHKTIRPGEKGA
jgi:hypothetical protein